jgi:imidazolonepropionase-like amidohydrolase
MDNGRKMLVIRDGTLIDGSGRPPTRNEALVIMPGLIDAHTHLSYGHPHVRGEGRGRGPTRDDRATLAFPARRSTP